MVSLSLLLIISVMAFGQQDPIFVPGTTKQDYLKKSKNQKRAAWVLLGVGSLSVVAGSIEVNPNYGESNRPYLGIGGLVTAVASIPNFIAAARNKKNAMRLSFNNYRVPHIRKNNFVYSSIPSLSLQVSF